MRILSLYACVGIVLFVATASRAAILGQLTISPSVSGSTSGGTLYDFSKFDAGVFIRLPTPAPFGTIWAPLFRSRPFLATDIGVATDTVTPLSDPNFGAFARELTDGARDIIGSYFTVFGVNGISSSSDYPSSSAVTDFNFVGAPTPNMDLIGYEITSITRTVESLNITPLNGGFGYSFSQFRISLLIEGRVPEPSSAVLLFVAPLLFRRRSRSNNACTL